MKRALRRILLVFAFSFLSDRRQYGAILLVEGKKSSGRNLRVYVNDRKYKMAGVSTVGDLQLKLLQKTGLDLKQQGSIMLNGKRLSPLDVLKDVGVKDGTRLNLAAPKTSQSQGWQPQSTTVAEASAAVGHSSNYNRERPTTSSSVASADKWNNLVKFTTRCIGQLMVDNMSTSKLPRVMDIMRMWQKVLRSSQFEEYMQAGEANELYAHVEAFRLHFLNDPGTQKDKDGFMKGAAAAFLSMSLPTLPSPVRAALKDPLAWRQMFLMYVEQFKQFDLNGSMVQDMRREIQEMMDSGALDGDPEMKDFLKDNLKDSDWSARDDDDEP